MAREFGGTIHNRFFDSNHGGLTHGVPRDCKEIAVRCEHNGFFSRHFWLSWVFLWLFQSFLESNVFGEWRYVPYCFTIMLLAASIIWRMEAYTLICLLNINMSPGRLGWFFGVLRVLRWGNLKMIGKMTGNPTSRPNYVTVQGLDEGPFVSVRQSVGHRGLSLNCSHKGPGIGGSGFICNFETCSLFYLFGNSYDSRLAPTEGSLSQWCYLLNTINVLRDNEPHETGSF